MSNNKSISNKISNNKISYDIKLSKKNYLKNIPINLTNNYYNNKKK